MCDHDTFRAQVDVHRLADTQDGDSIRCAVDLRITCEGCQEPLRFALPFDVHLVAGATMSIDGAEARLTARIGIPREPAVTGFGVRDDGT